MTERELKKINQNVSDQIHTVRGEKKKEFPIMGRLSTALFGPALLWFARRENDRLASGHTYEPPTFIERRNWANDSWHFFTAFVIPHAKN